ncbi:MAG TPA: phosphatase PAP2 family protein [bacterium]|nr:phosphatase PAP2 family protein [bacterium]
MKRLLAALLCLSLSLPSLPGFAEDQATEKEKWEKRSDRSEEWFFHDLPRHIGNDLKYSFWNGWHLLFLAAGAGGTVAVHEADPDIREAFQPERPLGNTFDDVMNWGFHPLILGGASLIAVGAAKLADADKAALTAGTMLEALALTETITVGLQFATHRERPDGSNSRSFPSGHTSGVFALATVAEVYYGPWVGVPSYVVASLVGVSRIDKNKHAASDVVAGAVLGTLIGLGTAKFHKKEFSNFFLVPTAGNGSAGLTLVHTF